MPKRIFRIDGNVINRQGGGIPDLRIEAWDKDLLFDDLVGSAITDTMGRFQIEFSEKFFRECFLDRHPDLFFKIYRGSQLIKSTEGSVLWNVKKGEIPVTIEINESAIEESKGFFVKGQVRQADKRPLANAFVRAFDKDLRSEQLLGETHTDKEGRYEISYTSAQFRRAEKKSADLIVRVYDLETGTLLLAESELIFNAKPVEVVDLLVTREISEYERYLAIIEPVRDKVVVADLTANDITFLSRETGIEARYIEFLSTAARLAKQTELPAELFYGLFRQDQPTTLSDLLEQEEVVLRKTLETAIDLHMIPSRLRGDLDSYLERLGQLKETDPGIQRKQQKEQLRRLGKIVDMNDAQMEAIVAKAAYPAMVTDKLLGLMVETGELQDDEAKALGLTVTLYQLCDENEKLAQTLKKSDFPQLPEGRIDRIEDLVAFDKEDWLAILKQTETELAQGFSREVYAAFLAKKIENLYPSKTMLARMTAKATDGVAEGLETLQPLFERNESLFGPQGFSTLHVPDFDADTQERLRQTHAGLKSLANTYPGLRLAEILDNHQLAAHAKEKQITARIGLLRRFHAQNPDKEFLFLDYAPNSVDLQALDFEGFNDDEQRMVLKNVKACQRMYSVTRDAAHAKVLLEQGHHSPLTIVNMSRKQFMDSVGFEKPVADYYYGNVCALMIKMGLEMFGTLDAHHAGSKWAAIDNADHQSISDYLKKIDGWEALFGNLDYCKCEHCRSIFSPAAYFVDLMQFLEKNFYFEGSGGSDSCAWETSAGFRAREDHPLHLRSRRPDLWKLPLTCENTHNLLPYLDIINEVLENFIAVRMDLVDVNSDLLVPGSEDRWELENEVYDILHDSVGSFRQPFSLPLERLAVYLAHFDITREDITRLLDEPPDVIAPAALMLSKQAEPSDVKHDYELITEPDTDLLPLNAVYGLDFHSDPEYLGLIFYDPVLDPDNERYEESKNDVQLLLKTMGLTRTELGLLITTEFVRTEYGMVVIGGGEDVKIQSKKRIPEGDDASVQNDIERIHGLSETALERMHRFTRLWRCVPWSIKELDLVLNKLAGQYTTNGITATTLQELADILLVQRRFGLPVEELCALWSIFPDDSVVEGKQSLFDRLFNVADFVRLDGAFPKDGETFLHPAFRDAPPPDPEVDYSLHRLLAGLRIDDEKLYLLIIHLIKPLRDLDPDTPEPDNKEFPLTLQNLSLLYRHARLAEALRIPVSQLFQLIRLAPAITSDHITSLPDLIALLEFHDWWKSTDYTLDELAIISGDPVADPQAYPSAEAITGELLQKIKTDQPLTFNHTVFAFLEGVTEEQSEKIIAANTGAIIAVPGEGYRVARIFGSALPIHIPEDMGITVDENDINNIRDLLSRNQDIDAPPFDDTLFTEIELEDVPLTEEQSRALIAANLGLFDKARGMRYRFSETIAPPDLEILIPEDLSDFSATPEELKTVLLTYALKSRPVFDDTVFTTIEGVTADHSRAIVAGNTEWIVPSPLENAYWLAPSFSGASLIVPEGIPVTETAAQKLLSTYHATEIIPNHLATGLGMSAQKIKALIDLAAVDLVDPIYTEALKQEAFEERILDLLATLLPLSILFKDKAFDAESLAFVREHLDLFGSLDITSVGMENIRLVSIFVDLLQKLEDRELEPQGLFGLLESFDSTHDVRKFYTAATGDKQDIQQALAQVLDAEVGLAATAHDEISLAETALESLAKLEQCINLAKGLGVGGDVLKLIVSNDYGRMSKAANAVLSAFRAKYANEDEWQEKIQPFEDKIRSRKRDALTDYLMHSLDPKLFSSLNDLYHHFLIDVELEGCARTSRVVAANSSVQLYVHRVLMNLEQDRKGAFRVRIDDDGIQEWKWRKNYRVWEANRKIFLYPENYLEPDLRDNKTPLFEELESTLLQQDINEETVLEAYAKYMRGFDEVANLKIAGSYHDKGDDGDFLHLFGVTSSEPLVYYYRVIENAHWSWREPETYHIVWHPWRKIDVQIPVKKVSPIVFNGSLYVFWVEISTRAENSNFESGNSHFLGYKHTISYKYTTLEVDGSWSLPQKIALNSSPFDSDEGVIMDLLDKGAVISIFPDDFPVTTTQYGGDDSDHYAQVTEKELGAKIERIEEKEERTIPTDEKAQLWFELAKFKPFDDYTIKGWRWDQIYPGKTIDNKLLITGSEFRMNSTVDFYNNSIVTPCELELTGSERWTQLRVKRSADSQKIYFFFSSSIPTALRGITSYSLLTLPLHESQLDELTSQYFAENIIDWIGENPEEDYLLAEVEENDTISAINGSFGDYLIDTSGDLLYLQWRTGWIPFYQLKRIGTTLNKKFGRALFENGVGGLLDTKFQESEIKEEELRLQKESIFLIIDQDIEERNIDFTGPFGTYFREIFFHIPYLIANHLNSQSKFAEAQKWYHYIFDPTAKETVIETNPVDRNWRYREFRGRTVESMREALESPEAIAAYKKDPFSPHPIARLRFSAYQKAIVMKYIDNLLDWGDHLFAQDTMESINEATLLYVLASDILGERPAELGECGEAASKNYEGISGVLDQQDNEFLIEMYHLVHSNSSSTGTFNYAYAVDPARMFSITKNAHDHVKIHSPKAAGHPLTDMESGDSAETTSGHFSAESMEISTNEDVLTKKEGMFQGTHWLDFNREANNAKYVQAFIVPLTYQLGPVFCVPPNTELQGYWDRVEDRLFKIRNCMNISGVRRELALFAPEIDPMLLVRAKAAGLSLEDVLNSLSGNLPPYRFSYLIERAKGYAAMLQGFGGALLSALEKKDIEELNQLRNVHQKNILKMTSQVREDEYSAALESIVSLEARQTTLEYRKNYYEDLSNTGLIDEEETQQSARITAQYFEVLGEASNILAAIVYLVPQIGSFFALTYGGREMGASGAMFAQWMRSGAAIANSIAASAGLEAGFKRRKQGWSHQAELVDYEIAEIEKQIEIANIRAKVTEQLKEIHYNNVEQQNEIYEFYRDKFSNLGLYTWLSTNLQSLFKEAYNNAYAMAKLAERAYRFERGDDAADLIGPNHWEASKAGLLAGERLLIDLQNLERRFIETNYRSLEIDQSFSLTQIAPDALIQLKETGECTFAVQEIFFNLFYPGHYKRKIKSARLTIPCITGPYTNVSATLALKDSWIRTDPDVNVALRQVPRSRTVAIATSTAQNDAGVFELNFRDERYMPFEGAGAISEWNLSLPKNFRQFDYQTINDVILHISYTAEQDQGLRSVVEDQNGTLEGTIQEFLETDTFSRVFSFRQEFSSEFNRLLHSPVETGVQITISDKHFPIFLKGYDLRIEQAVLILDTPRKEASAGSPEGHSAEDFRMSIDDGSRPSDPIEFGTDPGEWGGLPFSDVTLSDTLIDDHTITIKNGGELSSEELIPPDVSVVDSEKLSDIYLVIKYGIRSAG